jgi:CheY-like chemotaxis protein
MGITCPIVGVTANVLDEDREAFMSKGLTDFLTKPVAGRCWLTPG